VSRANQGANFSRKWGTTFMFIVSRVEESYFHNMPKVYCTVMTDWRCVPDWRNAKFANAGNFSRQF